MLFLALFSFLCHLFSLDVSLKYIYLWMSYRVPNPLVIAVLHQGVYVVVMCVFGNSLSFFFLIVID